MAERGEFIVEIPIAGVLTVAVRARDEADALGKAWERYDRDGPEDFTLEWEALARLEVRNTHHAPFFIREARALRQEEDPSE